MAATGQTGMGFPEEYGGGGDIGASIAAFETLAFGDLSVLVKVGVQFGLFGGAILQLGTERHHDGLPAGPDHREADGLLRDDRDRPRLQRAGARHRRDLRRRDAGVRDHHARRRTPARTTSATPPGTPSSRWSSPSSRSAASVHGVHAFVVPIRRGRRAVPRRPHRGRRPQDGAQRRRQRPDSGSTACGCRATALLNRFADVDRGRRLRQRDREPRTAASSRCSAPSCRAGSASAAPASTPARSRWPSRSTYAAAAPPVRGHLGGRGGAAARLRPAPAPAAAAARPTYALHFAQEVVRSAAARGVLRRADGDEKHAPRARVAGRGHQGARHLARHPHHPGVPRGVRRRRLPGREPVRRAQGRHRRLHHLRGRQPRAAAAGRQGPAHRLRERVRGPGPARHGPLRRRPGRRDRRREDQRPQAARAGPRPAARRRRVGPGGRAARLGVPARHAPLPRGAHARRRRPAAQARHRPGSEPGRGLLAGPGPRHRRGPRARRAAGARGVRRQGRGDARGRRQQGRARPAVRPVRAVDIEADRAWFMEHGRLTAGAPRRSAAR